jgi:hypothetical protein
MEVIRKRVNIYNAELRERRAHDTIRANLYEFSPSTPGET